MGLFGIFNKNKKESPIPLWIKEIALRSQDMLSERQVLDALKIETVEKVEAFSEKLYKELPVKDLEIIQESNSKVFIYIKDIIHKDDLLKQIILSRKDDPIGLLNEFLISTFNALALFYLENDPAGQAAQVSKEIDILSGCSDDQIAFRFKHSPKTRIDQIPAEEALRREWLREILTGEFHAIKTGQVHPEKVFYIARTRKLPVDTKTFSFDKTRPFNEAFNLQQYNEKLEQVKERAKYLVTLEREAITRLFWDIPGYDGQSISIQTAQALIIAKELRKQSNVDIEGANLSLHLDNFICEDDESSECISFSADLYLGQQRLCKVITEGTSSIAFDDWSEGVTIDDIHALDEYITGFESLEEKEEIPDSLVFRIYDLASVEIAYQDYLEQAKTGVYFVIENPELQLIRIAMREESAKSDITDYALKNFKNTIPLDWLSKYDIAHFWAALTTQ